MFLVVPVDVIGTAKTVLDGLVWRGMNFGASSEVVEIYPLLIATVGLKMVGELSRSTFVIALF